MSIPPELNNRLRITLLRCEAFESDRALAAVFVDERIGQWAADLPQASSKGKRVRAILKYLADKRNTWGENALVLFLHVLYEPLAPTDALRQELAMLADELEQYAPRPDTPQWDAALDRYREWVIRTYGTMRVLGKHEPVSLEGIYTDVYLLEQPAASRPIDLSEFSERSKGERQNGLELVKQLDTQILVILGKPGAGKTTFLKHIALQAATGQLDDRAPIFVALREWADDDDLLNILAEPFMACSLADPRAYVEHLLQTGRALLLFDALDEMSEQARSTFIKILERFSRRYLDCHILLTCRTAATPYQFERSKTVEVADFTDDQMRVFAANWFGEDTTKAGKFQRQIEQDERLRDLGRTPLLLGMLCLTFDKRGDFPQKRTDLYRQALDTLLVQWDESRNIERDAMRRAAVYHKLSLGRKHQMFSHIAHATFEQDEILIPKERLEWLLTDYLVTIPNAPARIDIDSAAILKAIEAQHGILVEYAHGVYAFLHPVFQEYYAAFYIIAESLTNGNSQPLSQLITKLPVSHYDLHWRQVIFVTIELLQEADSFYQCALEVINRQIRDDEVLTSFLLWGVEKSASVKVNAKPVILRFYYLWLALEVHGWNLADLVRVMARDSAYELAEQVGFDILKSSELQLDRFLVFIFRDMMVHHAGNLVEYYSEALNLTTSFDQTELCNEIELLGTLLTTPSLDYQKIRKQFQNIIVRHRNLGNTWWRFTKAQAEKLLRYFHGTELLARGLEFARVTDRAAIEDRLLLPPGYTEKA